MPFCPKCKSLLFPVEGRMTCKKCGYSDAQKAGSVVRVARDEREILVLDDADKKKLEVMPTIKAECPKCGHFEAYYRTQQTRKSDEPETMFLRCAKCDHRWRKY